MKESVKVIAKMFTVAIVAVAVYLYGINLIDTSKWVKIEPDYVGTFSAQPDFTNTVRSW